MNASLRSLMCLTVVLPLASGCASRVAPFDQMDQAQVTVLRLTGQAPAPPAPTVLPGAPTAGLIPGIPPELQQMGQQALDQLSAALPPGMIPPGLIPGQPQPTMQQPVAQVPTYLGYGIVAQMPLQDEALRDELLDIFGDPDSFSNQRGNCFVPGMGIAMVRPNAAPVELLVSLSCNQAQGNGFQWPHPSNGFTPDTSQRLTKVYEKLWGPVPPGGA